jgi:hypothetical protein
MSGRAAEAGAVSALAVLLTCAVAAPVLRAPSERIFGMELVGRHADPFLVMEQLARPIGDIAQVVGRVYAQPLTDLPGAVFARAAGPVAGYNWLVLFTFPLSAAAAFLLARYLTLSRWSAAIAAIAFAFSPFHLSHAAYHPHIAQTQWVPLYLLALWRSLDEGTPSAVALLAASVVGVTLSNFYGGLIAAVITPAAVAAYWAVKSRHQPSANRRLAVTIAALGVLAAGGAAYVWYAAPAVLSNPAAFSFGRNDLFRYSARWWAYFVPPVEHPVLGPFAARVWEAADVREGLLEQQVTLGFGLVALSLVAVIAWTRRDRNGLPLQAANARATASLAMVPVLAVVAIAAFVCSLPPPGTAGPFTLAAPSALLYSVVPMFRSYARFGVIVQLMTALLAAIGAERLWHTGGQRARIACVAVLTLAAAEYAVWPPALWRDVLPTAAHRWVTRQPARMNVLDCAPLTPASQSIEWLTGYKISVRRGWFGECTEPNFAAKLSATGFTHMLVAGDTVERGWFGRQHASPGLQLAARFHDGEVFTVTAPRPVMYTAGMTGFYPREYDGGWTWRWMGREASWEIVNSSPEAVVASLDMEMSAFHGARSVKILLDGSDSDTVTVAEERGVARIGPLSLAPGRHTLTFRPTHPPDIADAVLRNGDHRALSVALGTWNWTVAGSPR